VLVWAPSHFRGYLEALREIARVLRPTGTFVLIDPVWNPSKPPGGHHGTDVPTREELDRMLGEADFEIVKRIYELPHLWRVPAFVYRFCAVKSPSAMDRSPVDDILLGHDGGAYNRYSED
jgi:hypothetical protein